MLTIDSKRYVLEKLARFVEVFGQDAYGYELETLINELGFWAARMRLWTMSYQDMLLGVGCGLPLSDLDRLKESNWAEQDDIKGVYFYCRLFIVHPEYREHGISRSMIELIYHQFARLRYLAWHNRDGILRCRSINRLLGD